MITHKNEMTKGMVKMIYIADTADLDAIRHLNEFYPLAGVTTNPSIIAKAKTDFFDRLCEIRAVIGADKILCAQTLQTDASKIVEEGKYMNERIGGNFYVKVPISEAGLKATAELKKQGIGVLMTAIFTPMQALMAAKVGADFVAPYVNRIDNITGDGVKIVAEIVHLYENYGIDTCKVVAASFKNAQQVSHCASVGCHAVTVAPEIFKSLISHPLTDAAVDGFEKDWKSVYGDKMVLDF